MRYIGGKSLMLDNIEDVMSACTENVRVVLDVFSGTGVVAQRLKLLGYEVVSNDILYFSYVLNRGSLSMNQPVSEELRAILAHLNQLTVDQCSWFDIETAFIYQNYSPHGDCQRMYFRCENALKIDLVRQEIERMRTQLSEVEYFYLLSLLIRAVPYVSNITGTYGAYLKYWDKRTFNPLMLIETEIVQGSADSRCFNLEALDLAHQTTGDMAYLDPPYNGRQYLPNYHILETIARYDAPEIHGVTGQRIDPKASSDYCKRSKAAVAFRELLAALDTRYLLLSYNNEGLLSTEEMTQIMMEAGNPETFRLFEYDYRRYKNKIPNNRLGLKEQLYFIEKRA